jgi:hypothetical protein
MTRIGWAVASVAVGLSLGVACGSDDANPGGGGSGQDAATDTSDDAWGGSACGSCIATACESQRVACESEAQCAAWWSCVLQCPVDASGDADSACTSACPQPAQTDGIQLLQALQACRSKAACPCAQGDAGSCPHPLLCQSCPGTSTAAQACQKCFENSCCETLDECKKNPDCTAIRNCLTSCPQTAAGYWDCELACGEKYPAGYPTVRALIACVPYHCPTECGGVTASCLTCQNQHCAAERTACWADVECTKIMACGAHCAVNDLECMTQCAQGQPASKPLWDTMIGCTEANCAAVCVGAI